MTDIEVRCQVVIDGWQCRVDVSDAGRTYAYDVRIGEPGSFLPSVVPYPGFTDMERLVRETFVFLLEREPPTAILDAFDLDEVSRYFPAYPSEMRVRLAR